VVEAVVVAEVVRSGFVEGRHRGAVVALAPDGGVAWSLGPVTAPILPRSCSKPLQAVAMVEQGLDLPSDLLGLATASHSGEDFHLEGVRRILDSAGLDDSALRCPQDLPLEPRVRDLLLRADGRPSRLLMNCSGKHAAMLATCVVNGWDTESYLDPGHPLQVAIARTHARLVDEEIAATAVDGCGVPLLSTSLAGLARAYRRLALAGSGPEHRVATAIRRHPESVSGTQRDERRLLGSLPGAIAKMGAEACYVVALEDGRAFALKIDDGGDRARPVVMSAALRRAGVDNDTLRELGRVPLLGGGREVGEIRAVL